MAQKKPVAKCALCLEERPLCESHVITAFLYQKATDRTGAFVSASTHPHHRPRLTQRGFCEHLLCEECEGKISRWEVASASILRNAEAVQTEDPQSLTAGPYIPAFRLFSLAQLWRAHVARGHAFSPVRLGRYGEVVRGMLLNEDAGPWWKIPTVVVRIEGGDVAKRSMYPPAPAGRIGGKQLYKMLASGFEWRFLISTKERPGPADPSVLAAGPDLVMVRSAKIDDRTMLRELADMVDRLGMR
jgi:hypothetical protein